MNHANDALVYYGPITSQIQEFGPVPFMRVPEDVDHNDPCASVIQEDIKLGWLEQPRKIPCMECERRFVSRGRGHRHCALCVTAMRESVRNSAPYGCHAEGPSE